MCRIDEDQTAGGANARHTFLQRFRLVVKRRLQFSLVLIILSFDRFKGIPGPTRRWPAFLFLF